MLPSSKIFILSAPSGAGKTTLVEAFCQRLPIPCYRSISHTTRLPRTNEIQGKDYHFISFAEFDRLAQQSAFLETSKIYKQNYGTLKQPILDAMAEQKPVVLTLDYHGMQQVKLYYPQAITIFLLPPDYETLVHRLDQRQGISEAERSIRTNASKLEISTALAYDYCVVNADFETALQDLLTIFRAQKLRNPWSGQQLNAAHLKTVTLSELIQTFR